MGYRSEVVLSIKKNVFEKNKEKLRNALKDADTISENENRYFFQWNGVKWYSTYEDIQVITKFIKDNPEACRLIRTGEEAMDIEILGEDYDVNLYTQTSIELGESVEDISLQDLFKTNTMKLLEEEDK